MIEFIYESPIFDDESSKGEGEAGSKHQESPKSAYGEATTNVDMIENVKIFAPKARKTIFSSKGKGIL